MASPGREFRLRRARIRGFKALLDVDFQPSSDLFILIGGNGSGKSSVLQALAFIQYMAKGQPASFLSDRGWDPSDVRTRIKSTLRFGTVSYRLLLEDGANRKLLWVFLWSLIEEKMLQEHIYRWNPGEPEPTRVAALRQSSAISVEEREINGLVLKGSLLAFLDESSMSEEGREAFTSLRAWGRGVFSLELLSPTEMRRGVRGSPSDIGPRGERLGGFLAALKPDQKQRLVQRLKRFYPLEQIDATRKRAGWVDLKVSEAFSSVGRIPAAHMSDGFMRLLGLASIPEFNNVASTVLLDEVEDGIEPHILSSFIKLIADEARSQLIVTSHSPILVNRFAPEQIAFVARDDVGAAHIAPFSSIEPLVEGLDVFAPGELWANTEMRAINKWVLKSGQPKDVEEAPRRLIRRVTLEEDAVAFMEMR